MRVPTTINQNYKIMKLQEAYNETFNVFNEINTNEVLRRSFKNHVAMVKEKKEYKNLEKRIAWDIMHYRVGTRKICEWYNKYQCNDSHITTLALKCFRDANLGVLL